MTSIPDPPSTHESQSRLKAAPGRCSTPERVMLAVFVVTIAATCWLISTGPGTEDGHQPWRIGSILRVLTTQMSLDFKYPTLRGTEIKWLTQGLGAAAALLVGAAAWYVNTRREDEETNDSDPVCTISDSEVNSRDGLRLTPAAMAQLAFVAFAAWAMVSSKWAPWPDLAIGEGLRQLIVIIWAIAIGRTLSRRSVRVAALALMGILAITAGLGIWYHIERNPVQRLKFPIGNPLFMATCLLPGITLSLAWLLAAMAHYWKSNRANRPADASGSHPRSVDDQPISRRFGYGWLAIGSVVGLIACLWAFKWTDSRGPQIGLAAGLIVTLCVWVTGRLRRGLLIAILAGLIVLGCYLFLFGWPDFVTRRFETAMFRFYCWRYALEIFLEQPFVGKGQTAYVLLSQALSSPDAEFAPGLFPGQLMGHAHSEWLEILADLGAVGFALMAVALGATFWAASITLQRTRDVLDRSTAFGLLAAFMGIVVSEATGVALRMPGTPVIYYAVIGLLWAMSQADPTPPETPVQYGRGIRWAVLGCAMLTCVVIATVALRDWKGALANQSSVTYASKSRWDEALTKAQIARTQQWLVIEGRLSAENQYNVVAYQTAAHRFQQCRDMLARREQPARPSANTLQLVGEDSAIFKNYAQHCIDSGQVLLSRMPHYPYVAGRMANILLLTQQMEVIEYQLGLRKEVRSYVEEARKWLLEEYSRDRLDPVNALRLFQLSEDRSPAELLDLIRRPLRRGPWLSQDEVADESSHEFMLDLLGEFEMALAALRQKPDYAQSLDAYIVQARACASITDITRWPDLYAPETLRLAARARKLNRQFADAVALAEEAVALAEKLTDRFPALVCYVLIDQSRYLLLAYPDEPQRAVRACRQAIEQWPASGDKKLEKALQRSLVLYLLAAGDEPGARQWLAALNPQYEKQELDRLIGNALSELCQKMEGAFGPNQLPTWFDDRLQRCFELLPDDADMHLFTAYIALARNNTPSGMAHIEAFASRMGDPEQIARSVIMLLNRFPDNTHLQTFARERFGIVPSTSQPAASAPALH